MTRAWKMAGWVLGLWGGAQLLGMVLARNAVGSMAAQAALAEWGAGRMGLAWSDPLEPPPPWRSVALRAGRGAAMGAAAAILVCVIALVAHAATNTPSGTAGVAPAVVGLLSALLVAARDELLLRGMVIRATGDLLAPGAQVLLCGAVASCARLGLDGGASAAMAVEGLRGAALAALWLRDRGAWMAWGANAAWTTTLESFAQGGLTGGIALRFAREPTASMPALAVVAACAAAAALWTLRPSTASRLG